MAKNQPPQGPITPQLAEKMVVWGLQDDARAKWIPFVPFWETYRMGVIWPTTTATAGPKKLVWKYSKKVIAAFYGSKRSEKKLVIVLVVV